MLEGLLERCGWRRIEVDNVLSVRSGAWDAATLDSIPEEMVGALRVLSEAYNPYWAVERFVWALAPMELTECAGEGSRHRWARVRCEWTCATPSSERSSSSISTR